MPPYELNGKQVSLVDTDGKPIVGAGLPDARKKAALAGQVYQPTLGFATTNNIEGPQVSLRSLLWRHQPARVGGLESQDSAAACSAN